MGEGLPSDIIDTILTFYAKAHGESAAKQLRKIAWLCRLAAFRAATHPDNMTPGIPVPPALLSYGQF
jgi:hypothetical protein